jgi:hypothetical protein
VARLYEVPREGRYALGHHDNEGVVSRLADERGLDYVLSEYPGVRQVLVVDMDAFNRSLEVAPFRWRALGG